VNPGGRESGVLDGRMIFLYTNGALANQRTRINQFIKAPEVRVIDQTGENLGIKPLQEALTLAQNAGLDLIEIAPTAKPPVVRIMDLGKFQYQLDKEAQKAKKKAREVEVKGIRVRLGTGAHDLALKAKKTEEFMRQGNRVQIQLTLRGREKYLDKKFIGDRLNKILESITIPYTVSEGPKKSPRGFLVTLEAEKHDKNKQISPKKNTGNEDGKNPQASSSPEPLQRQEAPSETTRP